MTASSSSVVVDDASSTHQADSSPASSPPAEASPSIPDQPIVEKRLETEEEKARERNLLAERKRKASLRRRKKAISPAEREKKARELDDLLKQSTAFAEILTKKTEVLGRMIGIIGLLREQENYLGPHIIIAPLSTLSNWVNEFRKWAPTIPVIMYHGKPDERKVLRDTKLFPNLDRQGKPTAQFPVVCTSYEMVIQDSAHLSKINWEFIIIDEGHRLKNAESRLFQEICKFRSATRFLITGTPLQNNLKELWSLLHFLMPLIFTDWEAFETWFDFTDLEDEEGTASFINDATKHDLVKKIHAVLQPLLLRRVKAEVAEYLPPKREYVLYAPMTKDQTDLYNAILDKSIDTRAYLESKVVERLTSTANTPSSSTKPTPRSSRSASAKARAERGLNGEAAQKDVMPANNAFSLLMRGRPAKNTVKPSGQATKRKETPTTKAPLAKTAKSSRDSTPSTSSRGRKRKVTRQSYKLDESDDDRLSDDEFEAKLAQKFADDNKIMDADVADSTEDAERAATLELAKKEISRKKLDNELMQLRLVCNSPHNFYNAFPSEEDIDETIEDIDKETLRSLLLKDGEVFKFSGDRAVLGDADLDTLCDRSEAAYARAAKGAGNADGYRVVETGANGLTGTTKN
ncbi:hypothetical protein VSDG_00492 [Cytospora chrysosperma]|uniref:Helicase ATP-binding domain-containing protein n=1 Tax=Cytospora chrysosperma TaxID=252740 RepID=A0A423WPV8_CYTCH|nr:hypothetical protein VSDG_00492 [Valsa sordida]